MSRKAISTIRFDKTLHISECHDGWWIYDTVRGINICMRGKTKDKAFFEALKYYQKRLTQVEASYKALSDRVDLFIDDIRPESNDDY